MWSEKQSHYAQGREVREVKQSQIEGVCNCGYITLAPTNDFERHNGGLTVKRSQVQITDDKTGKPIKRLRNVRRYYQCNACVNDWK